MEVQSGFKFASLVCIYRYLYISNSLGSGIRIYLGICAMSYDLDDTYQVNTMRSHIL